MLQRVVFPSALPAKAGFCFSPCSPVPEILYYSILPPAGASSLTLPPAHLLAFDLQDLNNEKKMGIFFFLKAFCQPSKVMATACSLIPAKEDASCWEEGGGGAEGFDPPVCDILTALSLVQPHL